MGRESSCRICQKLLEILLFVQGLLAALVFSAIVACEAPTPTPAALLPTGTPAPPRPTATPMSEPSAAPVALLPTETHSSAGSQAEPTMLLNGLPTRRSEVWFVEVARVSQRPSQRNHWDEYLELLVRATNGILDQELVESARITSAAFSVNSGRGGAAIPQGDFSVFPEVLGKAAEMGEAALHTHRGLELFVVTDHSDLYLGVPNSGTLLLAQGDGALPRRLIEEMIGRRLDGGELDESLARLLVCTGPIDFLVARFSETGNSVLGLPGSIFVAGAGRMNEGDTSTLLLYWEFDSLARAQEAESLMTGQHLNGYDSGEDHSVTDVRRDSTTVTAQAAVPDIDVVGLLLGN